MVKDLFLINYSPTLDFIRRNHAWTFFNVVSIINGFSKAEKIIFSGYLLATKSKFPRKMLRDGQSTKKISVREISKIPWVLGKNWPAQCALHSY